MKITENKTLKQNNTIFKPNIYLKNNKTKIAFINSINEKNKLKEKSRNTKEKILEKEKEVVDSNNNIQTDDNKDKDTDAGEKEKENLPNFSYLEPKESEEPSVFEYKSKNEINEAENIFKPHAMICKYAICILLKEDSNEDSKLLNMTLKGIISNLGDLGELGIKSENIFIYIFVNKIKQNELVTQESIINNEVNQNSNDNNIKRDIKNGKNNENKNTNIDSDNKRL